MQQQRAAKDQNWLNNALGHDSRPVTQLRRPSSGEEPERVEMQPSMEGHRQQRTAGDLSWADGAAEHGDFGHTLCRGQLGSSGHGVPPRDSGSTPWLPTRLPWGFRIHF